MARSSIHDMVHRYDHAIAAFAPAPLIGRYDATLQKAELGIRCVLFSDFLALKVVSAARLPFLSLIFWSVLVLLAVWISLFIVVALGKRLKVVSPKLFDDSKIVDEPEAPHPTRERPLLQLKADEDSGLQAIRNDELAKTHRLLIKNVGTVTYWFDDGQGRTVRGGTTSPR